MLTLPELPTAQYYILVYRKTGKPVTYQHENDSQDVYSLHSSQESDPETDVIWKAATPQAARWAYENPTPRYNAFQRVTPRHSLEDPEEDDEPQYYDSADVAEVKEYAWQQDGAEHYYRTQKLIEVTMPDYAEYLRERGYSEKDVEMSLRQGVDYYTFTQMMEWMNSLPYKIRRFGQLIQEE